MPTKPAAKLSDVSILDNALAATDRVFGWRPGETDASKRNKQWSAQQVADFVKSQLSLSQAVNLSTAQAATFTPQAGRQYAITGDTSTGGVAWNAGAGNQTVILFGTASGWAPTGWLGANLVSVNVAAGTALGIISPAVLQDNSARASLDVALATTGRFIALNAAASVLVSNTKAPSAGASLIEGRNNSVAVAAGIVWSIRGTIREARFTGAGLVSLDNNSATAPTTLANVPTLERCTGSIVVQVPASRVGAVRYGAFVTLQVDGTAYVYGNANITNLKGAGTVHLYDSVTIGTPNATGGTDGGTDLSGGLVVVDHRQGGGPGYDDTALKASIELLRARFAGQNRGPWTAQTAYAQYDFVTYATNGVTTQYYANQAFTSGDAFNAANWTAATYAQPTSSWQYIGATKDLNLAVLGYNSSNQLGAGSTNNYFLRPGRNMSLGANCSFNWLGGSGNMSLGDNCTRNYIAVGAGGNVSFGTTCGGNVVENGAGLVQAGNGVSNCRVEGGSGNIYFDDNCQYCRAEQGSQYVEFGAGCQRVSVRATSGTTDARFVVPAGTTDAVYVNGALQSAGGASYTAGTGIAIAGSTISTKFTYAALRYESATKLTLDQYRYGIPLTLVLPNSNAALAAGGGYFTIPADGFYGIKGHVHMVFPDTTVYAEALIYTNGDFHNIIAFSEIVPRDVGGGLYLGSEPIATDVYLTAGTTVHLGYVDGTGGSMYPRSDAPANSCKLSIIRFA